MPSVVVAALLVAGCSDRSSSTNYAWVELGPGGVRIARVITSEASCPVLRLDEREVAMAVRAPVELPAFPVLTCEAEIPGDVRRASLDGQLLPLPPREIRRIAVIGDTGCRIDEKSTQACNDPAAYPFARIAQAVADAGPDLIVHVGDYLYREAPCPAGDEGCAGSPWGPNWAAIEADFFAPGRALFEAAPLVLTRGNHEACSRGGPVWFRFLEPRGLPAQCPDYTEPYAVGVDDLQFLLLDSSAANDSTIDPTQVARYVPQFDEINLLAQPGAFLLTHRPMWVFAPPYDGSDSPSRGNVTLQAASESMLAPEIRAVLSGHVHLSEMLGFEQARAPQLVAGNSGTLLDAPIETPLEGLEIAGASVAVGPVRDGFGFSTLDREEGQPGVWRVTTRDVDGNVVLVCMLDGDGLRCG